MNEKESSQNQYRIFGVSGNPLENNRVMVESNRSGQSRVLSASDWQLLLSCQNFATLTMHTVRYQQKLKSDRLHSQNGFLENVFKRNKKSNVLLSLMKDFVEAGFLVSASELNEEISDISMNSHPSITHEHEKISVVGIPTCGRPEMLKRCLSSYIQNFRQNQRVPDIFIIDDSKQRLYQQKNQSVVKNISKLYAGNIFYMDRQQRLLFANIVADEVGIEPALMNFALMGHPGCNRSEGGCRNAILLLTQGKMVLQTDDDTICQIAQPPTVRKKLTLTSEPSSDEYWFFKSYQDATEAVDFIDVDFLSIHEQILGKTLKSVINPFLDIDCDLDTQKVQSSFVRNMVRGKVEIGISQVGPVGDTGLGTDLYRLLLESDSCKRFLYPAENISWHLTTRQVIRSVTHPTISDITRCIGMNMATDNRTFLPPFMPVQSRSDGTFGDLLTVCFPYTFAGCMPYVLAHDPPVDRTRTIDQLFSIAESVRLNDIISELIYAWQNEKNSDDPIDNIQSMGIMLANLGKNSQNTFAKIIHQIYISKTTHTVQWLEQLYLNRKHECTEWKNNVTRYIETLRNISNRDRLIPKDIEGTPVDIQATLKSVVLNYGNFLRFWPLIYSKMKDIPQTAIDSCLTKFKNFTAS